MNRSYLKMVEETNSMKEYYEESNHSISIYDRDQISNKSVPIYLIPRALVNHNQKLFIPKDWSIQNFEIGRPLGRGKFGHVYVARQKNSKYVVALKILSKKQIINSNIIEQIRREIQIQTHLKHENILRMFGFFHDERKIYYILEYASGGELYKSLKNVRKFTEPVASKYIFQMINAFIYLHKNNVIHRDIKPQNILVCDNGILKISDFGWSTHTLSQKRDTMCGTLDYLCPEIIQKRKYDSSADNWGLGILTYELCVGKPPFQSSDSYETKKKIIKGNFDYPQFFSSQLKDFISKLLIKQSENRMKLEDALCHAWIVKYNKPKQNY